MTLRTAPLLTLILLGVFFVVFQSAAAAHPVRSASTGSCTDDGTNATCVDKTWKCASAVNYQKVTVTINAGVDKNGVDLSAGCTGEIGELDVTTSNGDGIKVGAASNLTVDSGSVSCQGRAAGVHQDGVQALGGSYVTFNNFHVACVTANNSQVTISDGSGGSNRPDHVIFNNSTFDPQGAGAYGISAGDSSNSGFVNSTLLSQSNNHDVYSAASATSPVWSGNTYPAGVRCNQPVIEGC